MVFRLFAAAMLLTSCVLLTEGTIPTEGDVKYIGTVLQVYKNGPDKECELTKEQKITLQGEVEYKGTTYVKVSRHIADPGTCDLTAYRLLIEKQLLFDSQPLFPGWKK